MHIKTAKERRNAPRTERKDDEKKFVVKWLSCECVVRWNIKRGFNCTLCSRPSSAFRMQTLFACQTFVGLVLISQSVELCKYQLNIRAHAGIRRMSTCNCSSWKLRCLAFSHSAKTFRMKSKQSFHDRCQYFVEFSINCAIKNETHINFQLFFICFAQSIPFLPSKNPAASFWKHKFAILCIGNFFSVTFFFVVVSNCCFNLDFVIIWNALHTTLKVT